MDIGFAFSFICFSSVSSFLQEFSLPFASVFPVYPSFCFAGLCVVTCGSPFSSPFRLVRSCFRASLPSLRFVCLGRIFSLSFLFFTSFRLLFFPLRVTIVFPCGCVLIAFGCFSLTFGDKILFSFLFLLYSSVSLPFFRLLLCSLWQRVSFGYLLRFPFRFLRLCSVLSRSLPVLSVSLSFFLWWFSCSVFRALFIIFFSCAIYWS